MCMQDTHASRHAGSHIRHITSGCGMRVHILKSPLTPKSKRLVVSECQAAAQQQLHNMPRAAKQTQQLKSQQED